MKKLPAWLTIPLSVFLGGALVVLEATPQAAWFAPQTAKAAALGALFAGLVAVVHYYMPAPAQLPK